MENIIYIYIYIHNLYINYGLVFDILLCQHGYIVLIYKYTYAISRCKYSQTFFFGWLVIWKINISIYSRYCPHGGFKFLITFPYQPMDFSRVGSEQLPL